MTDKLTFEATLAKLGLLPSEAKQVRLSVTRGGSDAQPFTAQANGKQVRVTQLEAEWLIEGGAQADAEVERLRGDLLDYIRPR